MLNKWKHVLTSPRSLWGKCHKLKQSQYRFQEPYSLLMNNVLKKSNRGHQCIRHYSQDTSNFIPRKVLLLKKITRYEYEKQLAHPCNEDELEKFVANRGSDYKGLLARHDEYHFALDKILDTLSKKNIEVKVMNRFDYSELSQPLHDWADMIITAGGDGTFLLGAGKVRDQSKPVIGINTDPIRSEGYLCLPKKYSLDFENAISKIQNGEFRWMWRHRIRLTTSGKHANDKAINLHDQQLHFPEHRCWEHVKENEMHSQEHLNMPDRDPRVLPALALNEVFVGESLAARVSYYEMGVDGQESIKQKSSGITICTGTGSTSWYFNINHICKQSAKDLIEIAAKHSGCEVDSNHEFLEKVTSEFNYKLRFDATDLKMAYTVRDPVAHGIFQVPKARGFCNSITLKSRMWDGWIVVDGSYCFKFNDGAIVDLNIHPEDALRCIELD